MRIFPVYAPKLIIKHVRIFLTGAVWVDGLGLLEFERGKFLLPRKSLPEVKQAIIELNVLLKRHADEALSPARHEPRPA